MVNVRCRAGCDSLSHNLETVIIFTGDFGTALVRLLIIINNECTLGRDDFVRQLVSDIRPQCAQATARCKAEQQRDHVGHFIAHKHPGDHIHKEMCHEQRDHIGVDQLCYAAGHKFKSTVQMCKNRI